MKYIIAARVLVLKTLMNKPLLLTNPMNAKFAARAVARVKTDGKGLPRLILYQGLAV